MLYVKGLGKVIFYFTLCRKSDSGCWLFPGENLKKPSFFGNSNQCQECDLMR